MKTKLFGKLSTLVMAVVAVAFLLTSCTGKNLPQNELEGYWVLKTLNGKDAKTLFQGALPTIEFHFGDSARISGTGGCNYYSRPFTYVDGVFNSSSQGGITTLMACTEDNQEPEFFIALSNQNNGLKIENGVLKFIYSGVTTLEFEKGTPAEKEEPVKPSAETLQGDWVLKTIDGVNAHTKFNNNVPSISFNFAENKVNGTDGCNNYNATFSLNETNLILGPIMSTRMACDNMESVAQFTQAIADTSSISLPSATILQVAKNGAILLELEKVAAVDSTAQASK